MSTLQDYIILFGGNCLGNLPIKNIHNAQSSVNNYFTNNYKVWI